ncbi:hypothetical protein [Leptospira licerasiae]|uniref:Lipoprotein n=1 Tax=Leptospira licerasiae str. MMD4847 TaxID=1049971 RepID=A0ABP2RG99_9LEPT|nr:hypothetical protein [Leptospira licerasiae]EIE02989.1 hypothetical protein LEP1GSC185_2175 [Leptospira licerasiae serovar Varillal str. VAR 010]EJZ41408.1 putative lipoprotein [Leptospira licerasiae str. MMD4847]
MTVKLTAPILLLAFFSLSACAKENICSKEDRACSFTEIVYSYIAPPPGIYIYSSLDAYQGNLANYGPTLFDSLMNLCVKDRIFAPIISSCANILPGVSSDLMSIDQYPVNFPAFDGDNFIIRGTKGNIVSRSFNWLIAIGPDVSSLSNSGITNEEFWSFTSPGGGYSASCLDGISNVSGDTGEIGSPTRQDNAWVGPTFATCDQYRKILCFCY